MVLFFTHIPFVVNHIINATLPERLWQNSTLYVNKGGYSSNCQIVPLPADFCIWWQNMRYHLANREIGSQLNFQNNHIKTTKFSQSDPPSLEKIAVRSSPDPAKIGFSPDPVLIRAHLCWLHPYYGSCIVLYSTFQGRNEVRWRPGQEASLAHLCSNLRSFGSKSTVWRKYLWHCWDFSTPL